MKQTQTKILRIIAGVILTPITIILYFVDRQIMVFLPHIESFTMRKWFNDTPKMVQSLIRVAAIATIYAIYSFIKWMI